MVEEAVRFDEAAAGEEDEGGGDVCDIVGEDIGGVGEVDAAGAAGGEVDAVVADAAEGDDFEVGELVEEGGGNLGAAVADEGADGVGGSGEGGFEGGGGGGVEAVETLFQERLDGGGQGSEDEGGGEGHDARSERGLEFGVKVDEMKGSFLFQPCRHLSNPRPASIPTVIVRMWI